MKKILFSTQFIFICSFLIAQENSRFPTIEELGWQMNNFREPTRLKDTDIGEVNYLLTFSKKGKITRIEVLNNTFPVRTEKLWRKQVNKCQLMNVNPKKSEFENTSQGTLLITRETCGKEAENN